MDALPMQEETGLPFASTNGNAHACGHDCHVAMLLGAAQLLSAHTQDFTGTVKLMFQPAEEILEGAKDMIAAGVLEDPHVEAAMMIHIISGVAMPTGSLVVFGAGANYASCDWFRIDIEGVGGHGANPQNAISPILIATSIVSYMQELVSVGVDGAETAIVSLGEIHSGSTSNVIPSHAYLSGTIRSFDEGVRAQIKEKLSTVIPVLAHARGGSAQVSYSSATPCVVSERSVAESVFASAQALVGARAVDGGVYDREGAWHTTCSEDFGYISQKIPCALVWLMAGNINDGYLYASHHPKIDHDESVLCTGAALFAQSAMDFLGGGGLARDNSADAGVGSGARAGGAGVERGAGAGALADSGASSGEDASV